MKRTQAALMSLFTLLMTLSLLLALTCCGVLHLSRDGAAYLSGFNRYADTAASGVTREDYPSLAAQLAAYFQGKVDSPQVAVQRFGVSSPAYNEKELQHLSEVLQLFQLLSGNQNILWGCTAAFAALLLLIDRLGRRRAKPLAYENSACKAVLLGLLLSMLMLLGLGLWAYFDFYSFFYRLHQLLFRSRLWLLDPQTDLLIQLMPEPFFIHLAKRAALYPAPAIAAVLTGMLLLLCQLIRFHAAGNEK